MTTRRITIGPVPVDSVTLSGALDRIEHLVSARDGGFVVTPNVDHIVLAQRNPQLRQAYHRARLSLADGQPLLWISRLLGTPLPERVPGSDLIGPLMKRSAERGWNVFFVGARPEVSAEAARRLQKAYPGLRIVGRDTSFWSPDDPVPQGGSPVARAIRESGADIVIVALGCPKQEFWMMRHATEIGPAIAFGFGGSLDFAAGAVPRVPKWMARAGFEWAFRLAKEPRRLAYRYLVRDPQVLPIFAEALYRSFTQRPPVATAAGQ